MNRVARMGRVEHMLIAAFLCLAGYAASSLTSVGQPEIDLTEKARARQPAAAHAPDASPAGGHVRMAARR